MNLLIKNLAVTAALLGGYGADVLRIDLVGWDGRSGLVSGERCWHPMPAGTPKWMASYRACSSRNRRQALKSRS